MSTLKDKQILLNKFRSGEITPAEFQDLKESIKNSSDSDLKEILSSEWNNFKDYICLSENKIEELYGRMNIKKDSNQKRFTLSNYWMQVAASILFIIAIGLSVLTFIQNKTISSLVEQNVTINSGNYGKPKVTLPDGTIVYLNTNSSLTYNQDFGREERYVRLSGEGFFEVKEDSKKKFTVGTEYMDIIVLGTKFNVYAYEDKNIVEMSLLEGRVNIKTDHPKYKSINVKPNEKVTYKKDTGELIHESTSNKMETSWMQKELVFRSEKLDNVFKCLSRKFAVTFNIEDKSLLNDIYTGTFEDENIESIMRVLKIHYNFEYKNKNNTITIVTRK